MSFLREKNQNLVRMVGQVTLGGCRECLHFCSQLGLRSSEKLKIIKG
ncbi:hypothetical protein [Campylobacter concisus]|nr:hypothetical protein [Campylobacter concisus]